MSEADREAWIAGMSDEERARLSESQGFGAHNISASGGYHAFTNPITGEQYYAREAMSIGDIRHTRRSAAAPAAMGTRGGAGVTINNYIGTLVGSDGMRELGQMLRAELIKYERRVPTLGFA